MKGLSYLKAARIKTWPASLCPVFMGGALAAQRGECSTVLFIASLLFALLIQIGTNYANDYYDFRNGVDTQDRIGPPRAVAMGWVAPKAMLTASASAFAAAFAVSIPLVAAAGLWSVIFVLSAIAFGILYTGGPRPLGYMGLGELLVVAYFGPVATIGTYFVQTHHLTGTVAAVSFAPGLLSAAVLIANNLRDEENDRRSGKKTLVVRWGRAFGKGEYAAAILGAAAAALPYGWPPSLFLCLGSLPLIRLVWKYQHPAEIVPLLPRTALLMLLFTILFSFQTLVS